MDVGVNYEQYYESFYHIISIIMNIITRIIIKYHNQVSLSAYHQLLNHPLQSQPRPHCYLSAPQWGRLQPASELLV